MPVVPPVSILEGISVASIDIWVAMILLVLMDDGELEYVNGKGGYWAMSSCIPCIYRIMEIVRSDGGKWHER